MLAGTVDANRPRRQWMNPRQPVSLLDANAMVELLEPPILASARRIDQSFTRW